MTFNMQSATDGYSDIVSSRFRTLSKVPSWEQETHKRFAMDALDAITRNKIAENQRKMQELGMQSQETDWLGLGMQAFSLAGSLSGGGGLTTGPDPGGQTINVSSRNPTPWKGPIFGTPGSMHRI